MDSETSITVETYPIAPAEEINVPRQRIDSSDCSSLPTDSMVTVRLSNSSNSPLIDDASILEERIEAPTHEAVPDMIEEESAMVEEDSITGSDRHRITSLEDLKYLQKGHRASTTSMLNIVEEETSESTSGTIRSRSDSSGTFSSAGSAHVDWEELEKSEEQAPRDEGSDEVRF